MTRVTTFTQSPDTVTPTELNNIQDDYDAIYKQWVPIQTARYYDASGTSTERTVGPWAGGAFFSGFTYMQVGPNSHVEESNVFLWDPAMVHVGAGVAGRKIQGRIKIWYTVNGTAPGASFTFRVRPITGVVPAPLYGYNVQDTAVDQIPGFTTTITTPAANATSSVSNTITDLLPWMPKGLYVMTAITTPMMVAPSEIMCFAVLAARSQ